MIERSHLKLFEERIIGTRTSIQLVSGPRQAGKTTMVGQLMEKTGTPYLFVSADNVAGQEHFWLTNQWETARQLCKKAGNFVLAVDEVQKLPNWREEVKLLWDEDTRSEIPLKVILIDSSRLLILPTVYESTDDLFEHTYIGHWSYAEMKRAFDWSPERFVWFGAYPGTAALTNDEERWKSYVRDAIIETGISRDILMLTRVDKPALMRRMFELGCINTGKELSYTKILGQLQDSGNTVTLSHYLQLLDNAGLLAGLEKFTEGRSGQRATSPKFQVHNNALLSAQQDLTFDQCRNNPAIWASWVKSAIGAHLLDYSLTKKVKLYYWRSGKYEIDYVVRKGHQIFGVEVKTGLETKTSGMEFFKKTHPEARLILVGKSGIPWETFLEMNPGDIFDW